MAFNRRVRRQNQALKQKNLALRSRIRKSKLSIPPVNQNPQPPNAAPAPSPPSSPSVGGVTTGPLAPATDPRDAQYYRDLGQIEFSKTQGLAGLDTQNVFAKTAYETALQRRSFDEPVETQGLRENANVGGAIYSSATQEGLGRLAQQQLQQRADIETGYRNDQAQRDMQRQGILGQYQLDLQQYLADAAERASQDELDREPPELIDQLAAANPNNAALLARIHALQAKRAAANSPKAKQTITKKLKTLQKRR